MPSLNHQTLLFSLKCFAAAMLAVYVAFALNLPRPFWAVMTVYITSSPIAGAVRSKAVYRLIGTLVGATMAVVLVPNLVSEPIVLSLALAMWVAGCLAVSLLDRTPRSYMTMLAGYTAALVGFPTVDQPQLVFDVALSRVEEIGLGIVCAAVVHSLVFPVPAGRSVQARLSQWLEGADRWLLDLAEGRGAERGPGDQRQLAAGLAELRILATHLPFDTSPLRDSQAAVQAMNERMLGLIPRLSGLADRWQALDAQGGLDAETRLQVDAVAAWLRAGASGRRGIELAGTLRSAAARRRGTAWPALLSENLLAELAEAVGALGESHALLEHLQDPQAPLAPPVAAALAGAREHPLHRDPGLALRSGATSLVALLSICAIWIGAGWPDGAGAAALTAIFTALFAGLDDPAPAMLSFGVASLMTLVLAAAYNFGVFHAIDGFAMLAVVVFPPMLLFGLYMGDAKTAGKGLALAITFASALALQQTVPTDFAAYLNGNLAIYAALLVAVQATVSLRSLTAQAGAQRLLRGSWASIARLAGRGAAPDEPIATAAPLVDRLALLLPRLAARPGDATADEALRDLRVAMNLVSLQAARPALDRPARTRLEAAMTEVAALYRGRLQGRPWALPPTLLDRIDALLAETAHGAGTADRRAALALAGLRRNLFPTASSPELQELRP